jgi:hypothetical protein
MTTLAVRKGHWVGVTGNQNRQKDMTVRQQEGDHDPVSNVIHLFPILQTRRTITMISRADAHRAAIHLIDVLGPEAAKAAHERTSEMLTLGDAGRYAVWSMILDAIEDILDQKPQAMGRAH